MNYLIIFEVNGTDVAIVPLSFYRMIGSIPGLINQAAKIALEKGVELPEVSIRFVVDE